ncbi:MAG: dephospho-CoA kinase [Ruminococcaceae bacterium]|nr:dephospho-CoA kinase [Oscillospiraceae bacterium]
MKAGKNMKIVGITGGTGTGKTTVLNYLKTLDAHVIDCDAVYHRLLKENKQLLADLEAAFGGVVKDGELDRKALGAVVFSDEKALQQLNEITHHYISEDVESQLERERAAGRNICAIDAIGLLEGGLKDRCDFTVGIVAPTELRVSRLMAREGITEEYARLRIDAQKPNEYFIENCDYTLENSNNNLSEFNEKCAALFAGLL